MADREAYRSRQRSIRDNQLDAVYQYWGLISRRHATSSLIVLDAIPDPVLVMLRRGRDFARLAPSLGINASTKRSRLIASRSGLGYDGLKVEFGEEADAFNRTAIQLRPLTAPRRRWL